MSFQPVVPLTGYTGWRFLERTLDRQQAAFANSQNVVRTTDYFRANIANIRSAEDLVADRRLLEVALGAFGLDEDINNKYFIQRILEDGTIADDALSNRLSDPRYAAFSRAFGFGDGLPPRTGLATFANLTIARYEARQFEGAIGAQDNDLRLALNVRSGIAEISAQARSTKAQWFSVMGNAPLRQVFEAAMGLPPSLAGIDLDQQLAVFQERAMSVFGAEGVADFNDPVLQDKLIRLFLVRSEAASLGQASAGSTALSLLQSAPRLFA